MARSIAVLISMIALSACGDSGPSKNDIAYAVAKAMHRDLSETQKGMDYVAKSCMSVAPSVFECKLTSSNKQLAEEYRVSWMRFKKADGEWSLIAIKGQNGIWQTASG